MSAIFRDALNTPQARRMLLELKAYTHTLPETLMIGAQHVVNYMEVKATKDERDKGREPLKPAKGVKPDRGY